MDYGSVIIEFFENSYCVFIVETPQYHAEVKGDVSKDNTKEVCMKEKMMNTRNVVEVIANSIIKQGLFEEIYGIEINLEKNLFEEVDGYHFCFTMKSIEIVEKLNTVKTKMENKFSRKFGKKVKIMFKYLQNI